MEFFNRINALKNIKKIKCLKSPSTPPLAPALHSQLRVINVSFLNNFSCRVLVGMEPTSGLGLPTEPKTSVYEDKR